MKLKFSEIITVKTKMIVRNPETASVAAEIKIVRMIGSCGSGSWVAMGWSQSEPCGDVNRALSRGARP